MGILEAIGWFFRRFLPASAFTYPEPRWSKQDLLERLGLEKLDSTYRVRGFDKETLNSLPPDQIPLGYWWHRVPKTSGEFRLLRTPNPRLMKIQRLLLRKLFAKLRVHPAAKGFRRKESVVSHASLHVGKAVVLRIDVEDFFTRTHAHSVYEYFRQLGWSHPAAYLLRKLCTIKHGLPQGAPTSPILSNLVNYRMDARLAGLAKRSNSNYSRYADDIIFSFTEDNRRFIRGVIRRVARILSETGYRMNRSKLRVMRQHNRQIVTGLVVNEKVQLPRKTRRWLRAVEHRLKNGQKATLTREQLAGWKAYQQSINAKKQ